MDHKTITLFGGKKVAVQIEKIIPGAEPVLEDAEFTVRQLRLREYQKAFTLVDDEIGLVAFACSQTRGVLETVTPDSYEALQAALQEVNAKGFFTFAGRQLARGERNLKSLPPEMLAGLMAKAKPSTSSMPSMPMPPGQG